jgi:hypothetical protein
MKKKTTDVVTTTANIGDRQGALEMFSQHLETLSEVIKVLVDGGHTGENFAQSVTLAYAGTAPPAQ